MSTKKSAGLARKKPVTAPSPRQTGAEAKAKATAAVGDQMADGPKSVAPIASAAPKPEPAPEKREKVQWFQFNIRAKRNLARIIDEASKKYGSQTVAVANAFKALGYPVTEEDLKVSTFGPKRRTWE